ncbi:hypothetical protein B0H13DRAFT_2269375 [Mycena leptocephala]|nr:hypothetical protein B0H13DRAFT_2269375 [Mycena leptocephala]
MMAPETDATTSVRKAEISFMLGVNWDMQGLYTRAEGLLDDILTFEDVEVVLEWRAILTPGTLQDGRECTTVAEGLNQIVGVASRGSIGNNWVQAIAGALERKLACDFLIETALADEEGQYLAMYSLNRILDYLGEVDGHERGPTARASSATSRAAMSPTGCRDPATARNEARRAVASAAHCCIQNNNQSAPTEFIDDLISSPIENISRAAVGTSPLAKSTYRLIGEQIEIPMRWLAGDPGAKNSR